MVIVTSTIWKGWKSFDCEDQLRWLTLASGYFLIIIILTPGSVISMFLQILDWYQWNSRRHGTPSQAWLPKTWGVLIERGKLVGAVHGQRPGHGLGLLVSGCPKNVLKSKNDSNSARVLRREKLMRMWTSRVCVTSCNLQHQVIDLTDIERLSLHTLTLLLINLPELQVIDENENWNHKNIVDWTTISS